MNGVQTRFKCKLDVKRCKRFVFPPSSLLPRSNALKTKAIIHFQTDHILTRFVFPPLQKAEEVTQAKEESKEAKVELNADPASAKVSPELDKEFKEAVEKGDFVKMSQLKEQGYQPSKELIQSLNETASGNTMIAVQKIFNLKGSANTLGDVKLAQGQQSAEKDLKRPLANTVNKMFADL